MKLTDAYGEADELLSTKEIAKYLGLDPKSLANSRYTGTGVKIPYIKMGKIVRYSKFAVNKYLEENTFNHTGETKQ